MVTALTICLNVGAILGGLIFGPLSEKIGRRRAIVLAALLALPVIPLWAFSNTPLLLAAGAFLIQIGGAGRLGRGAGAPERAVARRRARRLSRLRLPARQPVRRGQRHPPDQLVKTHGNNYGFALAMVCAVVAVVLSVVTWFGPEAKGVAFGAVEAPEDAISALSPGAGLA